MKTLYLIIGESGAGKDTITDLLCDKTGFKKVVSYTDAPKRSDQIDGVHHIFVTPKEFDRVRATDSVIAYTAIGKARYMATMEQIDDKTKFYIIDPAGVRELERLSDGKLVLVKIYIHVPEEIRRERTKHRLGYNFDKRLVAEHAQMQDFDRSCEWDIRVENDDLDKTVNEILDVVNTIENAARDRKTDFSRVLYLERYCQKVREYLRENFVEGGIAKHAVLREMEYVLREVFGLHDRDVRSLFDTEYRKIVGGSHA